MRMVSLTCKNHPQLRWLCKSVAYTPGEGYNGARNIFFEGEKLEGPVHTGYRCATECSCSPNELTLAPEDEWSGLSLDEQRKVIRED